MGIGVSIFLIALGAILAFAVDVSVSGLDLNTIGVILMIIGVVGLAGTMLRLNGGGGWYGGARRTTVVRDDYIDEPVEVVDPAPVTRRRVTRRRDVI